MQLEADVPSHGAPALGCEALEYLHVEFTLVVYNRDAGAVNKTYAGAFSETGKTQEHCQCHEATRHYLDKTVVREPAREQMSPLSAYTRQIIMLEVAVGVEVEADQNSDDLRVGHHALPAAFRILG